MRELGRLKNRRHGERAVAYFNSVGIETTSRTEDDDSVSVWVIDEDHLPEARAGWNEYVAKPDDPQFNVTNKSSKSDNAQKHLPKFIGSSRTTKKHRRPRLVMESRGPQLTILLILTSVAVTLLSQLDEFNYLIRTLYFSEYTGRGFPEIRAGQLWRLFTPMFLHGGFLHLTFNMLWAWQLGGQVETVERSRTLGILVLSLALACHVSQYLVSGPAFVGMSGVVYGLLGYVWMMGRFASRLQYHLPEQTVLFMLIWMAICLVGIIPNVANTQHVVGFIVGAAWGFFKGGGLQNWLRKKRFQRQHSS